MPSIRAFRPLVLLILLISAGAAGAQSVDTAGLEVDVHDSSGALIPGATVTLTQTATHDIRTGVTDDKGRYRFAEMPVGPYQLTVSRSGFAETVQNGITLSVGQSAVLNLNMALASANTVVQVNADVSPIDPDRSTIGQTIHSEEIQNLPSSSRTFLDFVVTVPGVTVTATTGQNSGFSVNGQRSRSNSIMIDGVENNGQINGNVRQTLSLSAIAQMQVLTEQFPAEYGGAGGGFVNIITKAGTDNFHGTAYYFVQNQFLNTPNAFATANPGNYSRNDLGIALGGPIKQDRAYFFGALEYIGIHTSAPSLINPSYAADINATLATGAFKNSPITAISDNGYVQQPSAQTLTSLRFDDRLSDRDTLVGRVLYVQYIQAHNINGGGVFDVTGSASTYTHTQNYFGELTHVFSPTLLDETHLMLAPQHLKELPNTYGPGADVGGVVLFGADSDFPVTLDESHYEADNVASWTHGSHLVKAGVQLNYIRAHSIFPTNFQGYWNFATVDNFTQNAPYQFTQAFGNPDTHLPDTLLGFYAEDSWKATSRLTLNYGVRYDLDLQPQGYNLNASDPIQANLSKGIPRDYNNFAPRIGLAYALDHKQKTVLRAGYGLFYDKNILILARNTLEDQETLILTDTSAITPTAQYKAGPLPQSTTYPTSYGPPTINRAFPGMVIPFLHQADLGLDRSLTSRMVLSATYVYVAGEKLLKAANENLSPPVILTAANATALCNCTPTFQQLGRPFFTGRANPAFMDINTVGPWGHSNYNGLRATLTQQAANGLTFRFGWVWSKAIDDAPDFLNGALPDNPYDPHAERALSNEDVRNRFTGTLVYRAPYSAGAGQHDALHLAFGNWIFAAIMTGGSGTPENITVGSDENNDDSFANRPFINGVVVGRDTFRGGRQSNVALRGEKEFRLPRATRLTFSAEAFNTFNHVNYTEFNTVWGTAQAPGSTFGQPLAASGARTIQLGIRYTF